MKRKHVSFICLLFFSICSLVAACNNNTTGISGPSVPGEVSYFTATPGYEEVALSWEDPQDNGGSDITGFEVSINTGENWITASLDTGYTFTGLTNGTEYIFKVRAVNSAGAGAESMQTATPAAYSVTFDSMGGSEIAPLTGLNRGSTITAPASPTTSAGGATLNLFRGWYTDEGIFAQKWDFDNDTVTAHIILYADWGYRPGDTGPGTGIIFHRDDSGFLVEGYAGSANAFPGYTAYYLQAAPENSDSAQWGAFNEIISDVATFTSQLNADYTIGIGRRDTSAIISYLGGNEAGRAAQVAASEMFDGFNDWFLPSLGELSLLYGQRTNEGIGITNGWPWSSSQYNEGYAWAMNFGIGNRIYHVKIETNIVRAIRAF